MTEITEDTEFGKELLRVYGVHTRCNEFAWDYASDHNATVKVGRLGDSEDRGDWHCWVYDHDRDRTIDLTLYQFDGHVDHWFEGDRHEHCTEVQEFDDREAFVSEWDFGMDSPFHIHN